jgi:hypothetical protein
MEQRKPEGRRQGKRKGGQLQLNQRRNQLEPCPSTARLAKRATTRAPPCKVLQTADHDETI